MQLPRLPAARVSLSPPSRDQETLTRHKAQAGADPARDPDRGGVLSRCTAEEARGATCAQAGLRAAEDPRPGEAAWERAPTRRAGAGFSGSRCPASCQSADGLSPARPHTSSWALARQTSQAHLGLLGKWLVAAGRAGRSRRQKAPPGGTVVTEKLWKGRSRILGTAQGRASKC